MIEMNINRTHMYACKYMKLASKLQQNSEQTKQVDVINTATVQVLIHTYISF